MKLLYIFILVFSTFVYAQDKKALCQSEVFAVRKNYEIWLLQNKIVVEDELEELPLSYLELLRFIVEIFPLESEIKVTSSELIHKTKTFKINEEFYNQHYVSINNQLLNDYCQGEVKYRLNPFWYYPNKELLTLVENLYDEKYLLDLFKRLVKIHSPDDFSFKRFEKDLSKNDIYYLISFYLRFYNFDFFKMKSISRLQDGLELKDMQALEYSTKDDVLRISDKFFNSQQKTIDFKQLALVKFEHLDLKVKEAFRELSYDNKLNIKHGAQFIDDTARNSVALDFSIHFDAFVNIPDSLSRIAPAKFIFFNSLLLFADGHPEILYDNLLKKIKTKKHQTLDRSIETRVYEKGDFQRIDFFFNHSVSDINQSADYLSITISCRKDLEMTFENKDFLISKGRVRVNKIITNDFAKRLSECKKFKVQMLLSGREVFNNELQRK
jgi:hypothetical protein